MLSQASKKSHVVVTRTFPDCPVAMMLPHVKILQRFRLSIVREDCKIASDLWRWVKCLLLWLAHYLIAGRQGLDSIQQRFAKNLNYAESKMTIEYRWPEYVIGLTAIEMIRSSNFLSVTSASLSWLDTTLLSYSDDLLLSPLQRFCTDAYMHVTKQPSLPPDEEKR